MAVSVKICGLTTHEAMEVAVTSGAQYLGFVIHPPSPRHLTPTQAAALMAQVPAKVASVVVCVDPNDTLLDEICTHARPQYLQLHGQESPQRVQEIKERYGIPVIKALGVRTAADLDASATYKECANMLLLDAKTNTANMPGGMGHTFDWSLLAGRQFPLPWFLSGGLDARNLADAISISGATMVDVSSGVESTRGVKDVNKIRAFLTAALAME